VPLDEPYTNAEVNYFLETYGYCEEWFRTFEDAKPWILRVVKFITAPKTFLNVAKVKNLWRIRIGWKLP
jgi:hypothetical protein